VVQLPFPFCSVESLTCRVVADVNANNIMLAIRDEGILEDLEKDEKDNPSPRKVTDERTIYVSRKFRHPEKHAWGIPVLCDLGEARVGDSHSYEFIQPDQYRAPEILMETDWSHSVDIWSIGCLAWDLLGNGHLVGKYEEDYWANAHMEEMVAYLGTPQLDFQRRSPCSPFLFTDDGKSTLQSYTMES
jgi:serine/threonine protein kinase